MKNKFTLIIFILLFSKNLLAEKLEIQAQNISIEKDNKISIFEGEVLIRTEDELITVITQNIIEKKVLLN